MTGATNDLDTPRQAPPRGNADIFISPSEGNRKAMITHRKNIGKRLSEALMAAVVGGVFTFMVWHQSSPTATQSVEAKATIEAKVEPKAEEKPEAKVEAKVETKVETKAKFEELMDAMEEQKADLSTSSKGTPTINTPVDSVVEADKPAKDEPTTTAKIATKSEDASIDAINDTLDEAMDDPMDEPLDDSLIEPKASKAPSEPSTTKAKVAPKTKAISLSKVDAKHLTSTAVEVKPAAKPTPVIKAEAKAIPMVKPEISPASAPATVTKSVANFPAAQADGRYLVTSGTFSTATSAEKAQKKLADAGIPVRVRASTSSNKTVHHVLTGPFATAEVAGQVVTTIKEHTGLEARFVIMSSGSAAKPPVAAKGVTAPVKATQTKTAAPPKPPVVASAPHTGNFVATAGSFKNADNANQLQRRLAEHGVATYLKKATVNGQEYTQVILGAFQTQHDADMKANAIQKEIGTMAKVSVSQ
ncbi:MAG: SPOR domain-containing protein [Magnetococcales bacterium]|nr:SPOR domain-containing protein [Magnetococcales bacterium]